MQGDASRVQVVVVAVLGAVFVILGWWASSRYWRGKVRRENPRNPYSSNRQLAMGRAVVASFATLTCGEACLVIDAIWGIHASGAKIAVVVGGAGAVGFFFMTLGAYYAGRPRRIVPPPLRDPPRHRTQRPSGRGEAAAWLTAAHRFEPEAPREHTCQPGGRLRGMRRPRRSFGAVGSVLVTLLALAGGASAHSSGSGSGTTAVGGSPPPAGQMTLTTTSPSAGARYAPTFTGNGELGIRVPPDGQGYAGGTVPAQAELAGFYAQPTNPPKASEGVQQRASIPNWSTLTFSDGGAAFSLSQGQTSAWSQSLDLRTGIITTKATWRAPDGHVTGLVYEVLTDRAQADVGLVSLTLTPRWSGTAEVSDLIDGSADALSGGTAPTLTDPVAAGDGSEAASDQDWVSVQAETTGIQATIASQLGASPDVSGTVTEAPQPSPQSAEQDVSFPVTAGQSYTITKYVGIADSQTSAAPVGAARATAASAASTGFAALVKENDGAWAKLWAGRIDIAGSPTLATDVNASEFYLWSSTRAGLDWSISPAGLSSNGYDGHIFWDAETWMYPSLLAQHPDLAAGMNAYREQRLTAAEQHASATDAQGARFPWESALDGTEQIPPPPSVNSEGLYEQHITADVALAQWQYYLATGDRSWLADNGWPVISQAAAFWASRARVGAGGRFHIDGVTGPDEENPDVDDEAYTNTAAAVTLENAVAAGRVLRRPVPSDWSRIAAHLVVPTDARTGLVPEFSGYRGQLVKQADVTMLEYPWQRPISPATADADLNYYVPRTDPGGPSMSDAINSIDTSELGTPGCASYVFTERSYQPFIRDVFHQFSETSTGGAFTFMTGIGGFLQEFLYGYSGMRFTANAVQLDPSLSGPLRRIRLNDVSWHGRRFDVSIGRRLTTVRLLSGAPLSLDTPTAPRTVRRGRPVTIPTAQPQSIPTPDFVRCNGARAGSSAPGAPALAAVDGSSATGWSPAATSATLTVPLGGARTIRRIVVLWGREWSPAPSPNVKPPLRPVLTRRPRRYLLQISGNGRRWRTLRTVGGRAGTRDTFRLPHGVTARFVRVKILAAPPKRAPLLDELTAFSR